jgi:hypothetical protein
MFPRPHSRTPVIDIWERAIPSVLRRKIEFPGEVTMPGAAVGFLAVAAVLVSVVPVWLEAAAALSLFGLMLFRWGPQAALASSPRRSGGDVS